MHSIGTLALRRSNSPSPPAAFPSPITVPKPVFAKRSAATTFAYEPRPSSSSTIASIASNSLCPSPTISSIGTKTLRKQSSWTSGPPLASATITPLRSTTFELFDSVSKTSAESERVRSPGGYDRWGGFSFDCTQHNSPKGFYVRSIEEFLGESTPARLQR